MSEQHQNHEPTDDPTSAAFSRLRDDANALDPMAALRSYEDKRTPSGLATNADRGKGWRISLAVTCLAAMAVAGFYLRPNRSSDLQTAAPDPDAELDITGESKPPLATESTTQPAESQPTTSQPAISQPTISPPTEAEPETSESTPGDNSEAVRTTKSVLAANPDFPVSFFADNDDCGDIADQRSHPDWHPNPGDGQYSFANVEGAEGSAGDWRFVESPAALSGDCLLALTADTSGPADAAAQVSRFVAGDEFHLSTWLYFPEEIAFERSRIVDGNQSFGYWQGIQISGVFNGDTSDTQSSIILTIGRLGDQQAMEAELFLTSPCGAISECPEGLSVDSENPKPVPVGRWVHFEIRTVVGDEETGLVQVWQDGEPIISYQGATQLDGANGHIWAIRNKGDHVTTGPSTVYVEDVLVSADVIHPLLFP